MTRIIIETMGSYELPFTASVSTILLIAFALTVVTHLALIVGMRLEKVGWKAIDYVWVALTLFGFVKYAADVRREVSGNQARLTKERAETQFQIMRYEVDHPAMDRPFEKTEFSPSDFDEVVRQFKVGLAWQRSLQTLLPKSIEEPFPKLDFGKTNPPTNLPAIQHEIAYVRDQFDHYEKARMDDETVRSRLTPTEGESINLFFTPLLLSLAFALRITKITGEILIEKRIWPPNVREGPIKSAEVG